MRDLKTMSIPRRNEFSGFATSRIVSGPLAGSTEGDNAFGEGAREGEEGLKRMRYARISQTCASQRFA